MVRSLPCPRAQRPTRALSSIMLIIKATVTVLAAVGGPHAAACQESRARRRESRVLRQQCRQRAGAAGALARAPEKRFLLTSLQPREVGPRRGTPGWWSWLPGARAPQSSGRGHTRTTRARLLKVVATPRRASMAPHWPSDGSDEWAFVDKCRRQPFTLLPPGTETFAMRSISHVVVCEVELTLGHGVPGMGFQEH